MEGNSCCFVCSCAFSICEICKEPKHYCHVPVCTTQICRRCVICERFYSFTLYECRTLKNKNDDVNGAPSFAYKSNHTLLNKDNDLIYRVTDK
jgi:hypothetical protein